MSQYTKIEWADHTFNPWIGCNPISPGCIHCYAADWAKRYGRDFAARTRTKTWGDPVKWNRQHESFFALHGRRQRVFCASLADVFDNAVPVEWRMDLFNLIADTPNLDWLILTKRIGNVMPMCSGDGMMFDLICERVWLGATIVNQEEANRDIPKLLAVPAAKRFLSVEPLLGDVTIFDLDGPIDVPDGMKSPVDWVIVGGESGPGARPMHPDWARSLRDQCEAAGVPFMFKQWGEHSLAYDRDRDDPYFRRCANEERKPGRWINLAGGHGFNGERVHYAAKVGKKAAGRLLDGRTWDGFPS